MWTYLQIEKDGYQWRNMNAETMTWEELEPKYLTIFCDERQANGEQFQIYLALNQQLKVVTTY